MEENPYKSQPSSAGPQLPPAPMSVRKSALIGGFIGLIGGAIWGWVAATNETRLNGSVPEMVNFVVVFSIGSALFCAFTSAWVARYRLRRWTAAAAKQKSP
jgi:hypothetical protein